MPTAAEVVAWKEGTMRFGTFLLIGLVALGGTSCASTPSALAGVDVGGKWQGPWQYQNASLGGGQVTMTLTQSGSKASGNMVVTGTPTVDRTGAVSVLIVGNEVHLIYPTGFTGYLTVSGDEMKGELDGMNPANVTLRRQR